MIRVLKLINTISKSINKMEPNQNKYKFYDIAANLTS